MSIRTFRIFAFALIFLAISAGAAQASRLALLQRQAGVSLGSVRQDAPTGTATPAPGARLIEFSGQISAITGSIYTIGGKSVVTDGQTHLSGSPVVGDTVKVEGILQPDGSVLANEISKSAPETTPEIGPSGTPPSGGDEDEHQPGMTGTPGAKMEDDQDEHSGLSGTPGAEMGDDQDEHQPSMTGVPAPAGTPSPRMGDDQEEHQPGVASTPGTKMGDDQDEEDSGSSRQQAPRPRSSGGEGDHHSSRPSSGEHDD